MVAWPASSPRPPPSKESAMKAVAAVAEILKREGVKFLIGYPVNPIIEAAAQADIRTIIVRQERTGLHMADAVSRVTSGQKIGVFTMQHGPGSENAFGGVAQAYGDSVPIVVLPGGYPRRITNIPPNFNSFINYRHVTKWIEQVILPDAVPDALRRAFTQVKNGRPRPVLVEIPTDVFQEEIPEPLNYTAAPRMRSGPDPKAVAEVAAALVAAERPVIYAGQGVHYAQAWSQLRQLAELLEAPVTTSLQGKSAFPENHPLSLGSGGRSVSKQLHEFLKNADVIFGIGCSFATTNYGVAMPKGKVIIHATLDAGSPRDQISPFWECTEPLSYIGWGKTTQLGYGLGLAMGAKLAHPDKLCVNVWGDAAIGFTGMDFETAVRERIPILSVLLNNFSMAIELKVMATATEKYRSTDISGNYAEFAKALGGWGERVTQPDDIVPAIRRAIAKTREGTPALLEFITEKAVDFSMYTV